MAFNVYDIPDMCTTLTFSSSDDWRTLYSGTACSNLKKVVTAEYYEYEYMHFIFRQYHYFGEYMFLPICFYACDFEDR